MRFWVAWGKIMKENEIDGNMQLPRLNGDKAIVSLSYSRSLEAPVNAGIALKAPWNLLGCDRQGYRFQTTRTVEGGEHSGFVKKLSTLPGTRT